MKALAPTRSREIHILLRQSNKAISFFQDLIQLDSLISGCRQLGRSYALSEATRGLRNVLDEIRDMFFENSKYLRSVPGAHAIDLRIAPFRFEGLADGCNNFEERLNEFTDTPEGNAIKLHLDSFATDMEYRGSSLRELLPTPSDFTKQLEPLEAKDISYYLHALSGEMENDLTRLTSAFQLFNTHGEFHPFLLTRRSCSEGISSLQYEEKRETDVLISVSTVGSLLSAVTVTALQISLGYTDTKGPLMSIVDSFWFSSLVLSIGAALNSLLSVIWKRTPHGSRGRRLPIWVTVWINASAPFFLAISIGCFLAGLALFTFASDQPSHTKYITIAAIGITSLGIFLIVAWFGYERWMSSVLSDVMGETLAKGISGKISHQQ
ncbi:hypothetical protein H0H87_008867, partial [Tephrocybe sp. NHM501043]